MTGCVRGQNQPGANNAETNKSEIVQNRAMTLDELNGKWYIIKIGGTEFPKEENLYMNYNTDSLQMSAYAGCNSIGGEISRQGRSIDYMSFDNLLSTQMMCPEFDSRESKLLSALSEVRSFHSENESLCLCNDYSETIIILQR